MFAEAGLSSLSRPPCVAQYVPSITGLQGSGAAPVGDCANNPVLETAMTVAATIANAKYRFKFALRISIFIISKSDRILKRRLDRGVGEAEHPGMLRFAWLSIVTVITAAISTSRRVHCEQQTPPPSRCARLESVVTSARCLHKGRANQ
jgi:hypothetical protein